MYKPNEKTIDGILINNLEGNELVNSKLIEYYLDKDKLKLALYYSKKLKNLTMEFSFIINSELFLKLKKDDNAIKLLKIALFDYNSQSAFYKLQNLKYKKNKKIKNFSKIIRKAIEIEPYLINFYYSTLLKDKSIQTRTNLVKKELFEQYLSYSNNLKISLIDFEAINLNQLERLYYLEKIITKNNYSWAKKLYKKILIKNPYLINLRRVLILNE